MIIKQVIWFLQTVGAMYLIFLLPAAPVAILCWIFGRKRVQWIVADFAILILPSILHFIVIQTTYRPKSLGNLVEPLWLGVAVAALVLIRLGIGKRLNQKIVSLAALIVACIIAIALWWFVPALPE